jgi:hypothetical protein
LAERNLRTNAKEAKKPCTPTSLPSNPAATAKLLLEIGFYTAGQLLLPITTFAADSGEW